MFRLELANHGKTLVAIGWMGNEQDRKPATVAVYRVKDGNLLASLDNVRYGEDDEPLVAIAHDFETLHVVDSNGALTAVGLTDGSTTTSRLFGPYDVDRIAPGAKRNVFVHTTNGAYDPNDRISQLALVSPAGESKTVAEKKAQWVRLFTARDGGLLAAFDSMFLSDDETNVYSIAPDGGVRFEVRLDFVPWQGAESPDGSAFLVSGITAPLLSLDRTSGQQTTLLASLLPSSADEPFRFHPQGASMLIYDLGKVEVFPLKTGCTTFGVTKINGAAYSPDGTLLAVAGTSMGREALHVVDLPSCASRFVWPLRLGGYPSENITFADDKHLWVIADDHFAVISLDDDVDMLLRRAREIAAGRQP